MPSPRPLAALTAATFLMVAANTSCKTTKPNPDHCTNNEGDEYCAAQSPDLPICTQGFGECSLGGRTGCVAELPADVSADCHVPCGTESGEECGAAGSSGSSGDSGESTDSGSTGEESTDESSSSSGPMPCSGHDECTDEAAPLCDPAIGECVACDELSDGNGDAGCAELDAMAPLCVAGECVACTADDTAVCDAQFLVCVEANECGPCASHDECESGACDIAAGTCFDPVNVLDVGPGQTYADIAAGLSAVDTMALESAVLRLHGGMDFNEVATVSSGTLAFVAAQGQQPQWVNTSMTEPTLTVEGAETQVYVNGLRVALNANDVGIVVDGGSLDIRGSRVVQNSGGGLRAENGASVYAENCFVGSLGDVSGMQINGSSAEIVYSTVSASTFGTTPAIACMSQMDVTIRNSIVVTQGGTSPDELDCPGATVTTTATETGMDFDPGWFADYNGGDYSLTGNGAGVFADLAVWQAGDPATDIDGDPRPAEDGAMDYAGADVPQ